MIAMIDIIKNHSFTLDLLNSKHLNALLAVATIQTARVFLSIHEKLHLHALEVT
jgi:hypothetical protein